MINVTVLGAGRVGSAIIRDLAADGFAVTAVDRSAKCLDRLSGCGNVDTRAIDIGMSGAR